jgi:alpha-1,3-mannosyltransferase
MDDVESDLTIRRPSDLPPVPNVRDEDLIPSSSLYAGGTCRKDPTLPINVNNERIMIAAMLYNNETLLPHWIAELLNLIGALGRDNVFISIVESGSQDQTGVWLEWLQRILLALDVPHFIIANGPPRVDRLRIRHLARLRNLVLAPLQMAIGHNDWMEWHFIERFVKRRVAESAIHVDKVLWLNDVYWCKEEALRLLAHDADIACASDFVRPEEGWHFYDGWVARDVSGDIVSSYLNIDARYFMRDSASDSRWKKGLPVQMASCWNGMVSMNAEGFRQGATFSAGSGGVDCRSASEERICGEFVFLGFNRILMDPSVRVTYERSEQDLYTAPRLPPFIPWGDLVPLSNSLSYNMESGKQRMCCPIAASIDNYIADEHNVDIGRNCCRLPVWPQRLLEERGYKWSFKEYQSRIVDLIHSTVPTIMEYDGIHRSKEEVDVALDALYRELQKASSTHGWGLKKRYNTVLSKLRDFGDQTCNGRWLTNDFELLRATRRAKSTATSKTKWSFDLSRVG